MEAARKRRGESGLGGRERRGESGLGGREKGVVSSHIVCLSSHAIALNLTRTTQRQDMPGPHHDPNRRLLRLPILHGVALRSSEPTPTPNSNLPYSHALSTVARSTGEKKISPVCCPAKEPLQRLSFSFSRKQIHPSLLVPFLFPFSSQPNSLPPSR